MANFLVLLLLCLAPFTRAIEPTEYQARRAAVANAIGPNAMLIMTSPPEVRKNGDEAWPFRQDNDLYYLTGINVPGTTLVIIPGEKTRKEFLFIAERNATREVYKGADLSRSDLSRISGVKEVLPANEFNYFLKAAIEGLVFNEPQKYAFFASPSMPAYFRAVRDGKAEVFFVFNRREVDLPAFSDILERLRNKYPELRFRDATHLLVNQREIKSPAELALIQHAIDITIEAQKAGMKRAQTATREYEVQATVEYTFRDQGASGPGFASIVATGINTTTLHYTKQDGQVATKDLMLLDIGAEVEHYSADITNTFPVSGVYSPEQKAIYNAVLRTNRATMQFYKPHTTLAQIDKQAFEMTGKELFSLGLVTDPKSFEQTKLYYMHGIGHQLGLAVHDVYDRERKLEPGMVLTVEPGIYVNAKRIKASETWKALSESERSQIESALTKYDGIGVRIEDDVLVTHGDPKNLSSKMPRTVDEIETLMRAH